MASSTAVRVVRPKKGTGSAGPELKGRGMATNSQGSHGHLIQRVGWNSNTERVPYKLPSWVPGWHNPPVRQHYIQTSRRSACSSHVVAVFSFMQSLCMVATMAFLSLCLARLAWNASMTVG